MLTLPCANTKSCQKAASSFCSRCRLVKYCGADCQRAHWKSHKNDCNSPLSKSTWSPQWCTQNRQPAFMTDDHGPRLESCGLNKYLWGNMPAFDHIRLGEYEGAGFEGELDILFAASGDLRNVIASANATTTKGKLHIVINDLEFYVAIRSTLLLIVFASLPPAEAAETALHFWYSPKLPSATMHKLRSLFSEKLDKMRKHLSGPSDGILATNIQLSDHCYMRSAFSRSCWKEMFLVLDSKLSSAEATRLRHSITQREARRDYRERHLYMIPQQYRLSKVRYYEDGLVLPFGADRSSFTEANPTLFDHRGRGWLCNDGSDPLGGWNIYSAEATGASYGVPKNDIYGALYYYLLVQFEMFARRLQTRKDGGEIHFTMLSCDARHLQTVLKSSKSPRVFDRVDVSNLTDGGHLGVSKVLQNIGPLLKETSSAYLHSLFMNYAAEAEQWSGITTDRKSYESAAQIMKTVHMTRESSRGSLHPGQPTVPIFQILQLGDALKDFGALWNVYYKFMNMDDELRKAKMVIRRIDRPYQIRRIGSDLEVMEKWQRSEIWGVNGHECYVKWGKLPVQHDVD